MKFLAWDTSSKTGAIVTFETRDSEDKGKPSLNLIAEFVLNVDSTHSERLLWGIHQVLESARWKLEDVDVFGVGVGPGSFTGLRIGVTTARTLAHSLNKPLVGVSSLAVLARPKASKDENLLVVAVTDACKGELFALWGNSQDVAGSVIAPSADSPGLWNPEVKEAVIEPAHLMVKLAEKLAALGKNTKWIAVGEGRSRYLSDWASLPAEKEIRQDGLIYSNQIEARSLGQLVWEAYQAGGVSRGLDLSPRYLRLSNAELKLKGGTVTI